MKNEIAIEYIHAMMSKREEKTLLIEGTGLYRGNPIRLRWNIAAVEMRQQVDERMERDHCSQQTAQIDIMCEGLLRDGIVQEVSL